MFHVLKSDRGYELADETGTLESEFDSIVYKTYKEARIACETANFPVIGFDELCALECINDR